MSTSSALVSPSRQVRSSAERAWYRRPLVRVIALGLVLLAGALAVAMVTSRSPSAAPRYQTVAIERGTIAARVTANGTLSALVTVSVGSQVSGRIESLGADFGSKVTKGDVIAKLDPSLFLAVAAQARANYQAALATLDRAQAKLLEARRQFERAGALRAEGIMTGSDYDTADAALAVARADLRVAQSSVAQSLAARQQAELNLRYTTIVSPIDGIVISRNVDVGQTVAATLQAPTLFTIAQDLTRMQVDTNVAEADIGKIRPGMNVGFYVDSYPGRSFPGQVRQVRDNAQTIQNVVTYDAVVDVDNSERLLKPGMTASVTFTYAEHRDVLRVPNVALRFRPDAAASRLMNVDPTQSTSGDQRRLWLLREGRAVPVPVQIGLGDGMATELVSSAVSVGEQAIVEVLP